MSGLEPLKRLIYHEKQEKGSMLCAQHALNTLLQGNYFTASDLSAIAIKVDTLERSIQTENRSERSSNMDDTGFFSVQVINEALQVWGLRMVHWRSSEMAEYQDRSYAQFAFILNLEQHWFTLRRFGIAAVVEQATPEEAEHVHWFNLNSFLDDPEWIGRIYLNMMLKQAEEEGYSVYAVARIDPESPFPLGNTTADEVASTLKQPRSRAQGGASLSTNRAPPDQSVPDAFGSRTEATDQGAVPEGLEDEDMELQAILQASITGVDVSPTHYASRGGFSAGPSVRTPTQETSYATQTQDEEATDDDPVASSLARSKAIMEQMFREQEAALRDNYDDEVRGIPTVNRWAAFGRPSGSQELSRKRTRGEEEEDEELQKAIAASKAGVSPQEVVSEDSDEEEERPPRTPRESDASARQRFADHTGVYDDDDEALQAALRASLEDAPGGATIPEEIPRPPRAPERSQQTLMVEDQAISRTMSKAIAEDEDDEDMDEDMEEAEAEEKVDKGKEKETEQPEPDVDEMRRRRLARFGGGG